MKYNNVLKKNCKNSTNFICIHDEIHNIINIYICMYYIIISYTRDGEGIEHFNGGKQGPEMPDAACRAPAAVRMIYYYNRMPFVKGRMLTN